MESDQATPMTGADWSDVLSERFRERKLPRDMTDCLMGLSLGLFFVPVCVGGMAAVVFIFAALLNQTGVGEGSAGIIAVVTAIALLIDGALLVALPAFRGVTIDREGLLFRRYVGPAKKVFWNDLVSVTEASRREVMRRAWLFPGFPPRGSWNCGSSRDQFRIAWRGGHYYFPPDDPEGFVAAVRRFRPDAVCCLSDRTTTIQ